MGERLKISRKGAEFAERVVNFFKTTEYAENTEGWRVFVKHEVTKNTKGISNVEFRMSNKEVSFKIFANFVASCLTKKSVPIRAHLRLKKVYHPLCELCASARYFLVSRPLAPLSRDTETAKKNIKHKDTKYTKF